MNQIRNVTIIHFFLTSLRMFKLSELVRWLGLTEFEIMINLCGLLVFTVTLALRISGISSKVIVDWFTVFSPLFCIDICNAYFCVIIGIRMYLDSDNKRKALHRFLWSTYFLFLVAIFKYLLCLKLTGQTGLEYSEVFSPIFVLLQLVAVRACQLPNSI
ncbi:transmembrane protein 203 [Glossina fuscipes]|uniref:Transmembrane protein 203 n=2 Tax=Glossina TaxID=7393 RepID=A0A9C6DSH3_9MUSC|nr:transmembrane protein 203 [Glossina fuscipes]XP_037889623.1 transmembrane protein 203 [Glossina fuscipes]XP_037889624.1 transmembrane protein 203 [Glossina fuscipes]XP_037889627.1 transmembrane protein 203 [Glossina fuscipes]